MTYQIRDWDTTFENAKSRTYENCSRVSIPNHCDGLGLSTLLSEEDGAALYGIFHLLVCLCSRQRKPRNGWLTVDGTPEGRPISVPELARVFRRPDAEIVRALERLAADDIAWLEKHHADGQETSNGYHADTTRIPSIPLLNSTLLNSTQSETPASRIPADAGLKRKKKQQASRELTADEQHVLALYDAYPRKDAKPAALKAIRKALQKISFDELLPKVKAFAAFRANEDAKFTPFPATWFNGERWNDSAPENLAAKSDDDYFNDSAEAIALANFRASKRSNENAN